MNNKENFYIINRERIRVLLDTEYVNGVGYNAVSTSYLAIL